MARGDKDYDKKVRKVNKGQKSGKKIDAVHKMVESLIKNDSDEAAEHLHTYLQMTAREILLGEAEECEEEDDKDSKKKDDKEDKSDDKDDDDKEEKDDDKDSDDSDDDDKEEKDED